MVCLIQDNLFRLSKVLSVQEMDSFRGHVRVPKVVSYV